MAEHYADGWEILNTALSFFLFSPQDSSQIELLKELMDLQKDMVVMLLSMLEGRLVHEWALIKNQSRDVLLAEPIRVTETQGYHQSTYSMCIYFCQTSLKLKLCLLSVVLQIVDISKHEKSH